jgi:CHASE3 domain sensor protein
VIQKGVMTISPEDRKRLEELGELQVRLIFMTTGFSSPFQISARKWLAELDEAQRKRDEAQQRAKLAQQSERTLKAAWIAACAAIGAIVVTILAWIFSLH